MTGYGRGEVVVDGLRLAAEVRSVNHRFCELSARLPRALAAYEAEARKIIQERTQRGKINLIVSWGGDGEDGREPAGVLKVDDQTADRYIELLQGLKKKYTLSGDVDIKTLAGMPSLFVWTEEGRDPDSLARVIGIQVDVRNASRQAMQIGRASCRERGFRSV